MLSDNEMRELLQHPRTIAVVGLSANPNRASHGVSRRMQTAGHRVIPVNPVLDGPVLGEASYDNLTDVTESIDIVNIFRRSEYVSDIVDDAIAIGAKVVWMQLDVIDAEAAKRAEDAGLGVVMDRCLAIEYGRLVS